MSRVPGKILRIAGCLFFIAAIAGCATTGKKVTVLYQPVVNATGGSGELYLASASGKPDAGKPGVVQWVIGKVKNSDGDPVGDVVSPMAPGDLFQDALNRELTNAGYKVVRVESLPAGVGKGLFVTMTNINLDEASSILKDEGSGRISMSLELWKNGKAFKKLYYESGYSDFAVKDRDLLLPDILQKSLQSLMKQAVPEIIKELGK